MSIDSLILKLNVNCNFRCTFCSSGKLSNESSDYLDTKYVFDFLKRFPNTSTLIINGGEPLLPINLKPLISILNYIETNNLNTNISITSNLWSFYKNPEIWINFLKHPKVGCTTSFQYDLPGKGRLKPDFSNYTEEDFWKVSDLMLDKVGYRPDFISVITEDNKHLALNNVELAKRMSNNVIPTGFRKDEKKTGVECKLNYVMASGPIIFHKDKFGNTIKQGASESMFILSDIYEIYVDIYNKGLASWEFATKEMSKVLKDNGKSTMCPLNRSCDSGIRCLQPTTNKKLNTDSVNASYYTCGAFGDDLDVDSSVDFNEEVYNNKFFTPLQNNINLHSIKRSCNTCPMFFICNSCRKTISDFKKKGGQIIEQHCIKMKSLAPEILKINGFSEEEIKLKLTPYIKEYN